jgi:hypothetical protein
VDSLERADQEISVLLEIIAKKDELLTRAADALEPLNEIYPQQKRSDLIAELRKAAE